MKSITDIKDLKGKRVLVRSDFNVPVGEDGVVGEHEAFRIKQGMDTLLFLQEVGAKTIVISHIGRDPQESLRPVAEYLKEHGFPNLNFISEVLPDTFKLENGEIVMFENLRSDEREKTCDEDFAQDLASYADIYVNDAFAVSHREHASVVGISKFLPSYAGVQLTREIEALSRVYSAGTHPFVFILGGAKMETKLPLISQYLKKADTLCVAGALMNTLFYMQGKEIGVSVYDSGEYDMSSVFSSDSLLLPQYVLVEKDGTSREIHINDVTSEDKIVDIGIRSLEELKDKIKNAKLVVWNGPTGWYEGGYEAMTNSVLEIVAGSNAETIVGGGDTVSLLLKKNMEDRFSFVSTGGGAMLEFLTKGTLPGIEALK